MPNTVATWGGLEIQLVSQEVVDTLNAIKGVIELLNEALDLAVQVGEIAKTFITSNLNLVRSLVQELITLLRNLLQDLFSVGLYANFVDFNLLVQNKNNVLGGYSAFERRMITRLNDRNDPNRPNFTESSTVLAVFFYVGVDLSFVGDLLDTKKYQSIIQFGKAFGSLFGMTINGFNDGLPVPVNLHAEYARSGTTTSQDVSLIASAFAGKDKIRLVWNSAPARGGGEQDPSPQIPPSGYIVEVSCFSTPFQVGWVAPATSGTGGVNGTGSNDGAQSYTVGQYQAGNTGQPLAIFGGMDAIELADDVQWPSGWSVGQTLPRGAHPAYFFLDPTSPTVIRTPFAKGPQEIENGEDVSTYYNQRRFFVPYRSVLSQTVLGGNYTFDLDPRRLPKFCPISPDGTIDTSAAETPSKVYVRVIPISERVTAENYQQCRWRPRAHATDNDTLVDINPVPVPGTNTQPISLSDFGTPSAIVEVAIPNENENLYARAVQAAIAILAISRSDLVPPSELTENQPATPNPTYRATGLESLSTEVFRWMSIDNPDTYFSRRRTSPQSFVEDLYPRIVELADKYLRTQGTVPPALLESLSGTFHDLVDWKWNDSSVSGANGNRSLNYTILESLDPSNYQNTPLAKNRYCTRYYYAGATPNGVLTDLATKWREGTFGATAHPTSLDSSPVIGPTTNAQPQYWFARDLIPEAIYSKARTVLGLTADQSTVRSPARPGWLAARPFTLRVPTGNLLTAINKVEGLLNVVEAGLQTGADAILRTISFLEQRVSELQELLRRIEQLLDIPYQIAFPSAKLLLLVTNGTSGVMSGLLQSNEKPTEGPNGYGAGGVMMAGGPVPRVLIELLSAGIQSVSGD
jgi:hypothetical protein